MSDDFLKLVSQANPAASQYQHTNTGYPPPSEPQLDPFFDDDDEGPDTAFGRPTPMQSQASGLPLTKSAAPHAGTGVPQGWSFDDEDPNAYPSSSSYPGPSKPSQTREKKKRKSWKPKWSWPWQKKEVVLAGERVIGLNSPDVNIEFCSNYVSTTKYNSVTFVPKFLFGECLCMDLSFRLSVFRTILEIRKSVLLVHRLHSTNTRRVTDE